jgi:hypothetical protein
LATDHIYTFEVRARDAAGNVDATPASHQFGTVPQMPFDQATGEAATALYVPDQEVMDAPASCGGSTEIDCDNGQPLPPSDQISVAATRSVLTVTNADRYDVSATLTIKTVAPIKVKLFGTTCDLTFDSANGTSSTWGMTFQMPKQAMTSGEFSLAPYGEVFLQASNQNLSRVESADYALSGNILCPAASASFPASALADTITGMLAARMRYLCMAPGPALFETCPWVPY